MNHSQVNQTPMLVSRDRPFRDPFEVRPDADMESTRNPFGRRAHLGSRIHLRKGHGRPACFPNPKKPPPKTILAKRIGKLRSLRMNVTAKTNNGTRHTSVSPRFSSLLTAHSALFTSLSPLSPRNPLFPRLRSGHQLFQRPSPQKQIPSNLVLFHHS